MCLLELGDGPGQAIEICERLAARGRVLGPGHPQTLPSRGNLANAYQDAGRTGEAAGLNPWQPAGWSPALQVAHPDAAFRVAAAKSARMNPGIAETFPLSSPPRRSSRSGPGPSTGRVCWPGAS